jgi:hypothetical protein
MEFDSNILRICHQCVGDHILTNEIKDSDAAKCSYCGSMLPSWPLQALAERIEIAFQEHYIRTSPEPNEWQYALLRDGESHYDWERDGEPVLSAIEDAAGIPNAAASDVLNLLSERYCDQGMEQLGGETAFDSQSYYELKGCSDLEWQFKWEKFERSLQTESRYFSRNAAAHLGAVFGDIDLFNTWESTPLVVDAGPDTPISVLYRARVFQSHEALKPAMCRPDKELGSPPGRFAASGRMNARGISVFYGATAQKVALAEVRPPVGSDVALAAFKIIRPLRLLDLSALEKTHIRGSVFDPNLVQSLNRVAFLRTLGKKLTRPVMPADQELDYLATQAVSDFLATENTPVLDGIVFESTQANGGRNIVLFHKASRVREMDLPAGTEISATTVGFDEDGPYPEFDVSEVIRPHDSDNGVAAKSISLGEMFWDLHLDSDQSDSAPTQYTLEVLPESVEVHHVEKFEVKCTPYKVTRRRRQWQDNGDF